MQFVKTFLHCGLLHVSFVVCTYLGRTFVVGVLN